MYVRQSVRPTAFILASSLLLTTSCSNPTVQKITEGARDVGSGITRGVTNLLGGSDDPNDVCYQQRTALRSEGNFFAQSIVKGLLGGAAIGGLGGLLVGRSAESAVKGALAGALVGAAAGYWSALQRENTDRQALVSKFVGDVTQENQQIDRAQAAFDRLVQCRREQAAQVRADVAAGRITPDEGNQRMAAVRAAYESDLQLARKVSQGIHEHSDSLAYANEQLKPQPYVVVASAPVYAEATETSAPVATSLRAQTVVEGAAYQDQWVKVTAPGGQTGYVKKDAVKLKALQEIEAKAAAAKKAAPKPKATAAQKPAPVKPKPVEPPRTGDQLTDGVYTNIAKRQDFQTSVEVAEEVKSEFELPSA